jgi:hypothetical protein
MSFATASNRRRHERYFASLPDGLEQGICDKLSIGVGEVDAATPSSSLDEPPRAVDIHDHTIDALAADHLDGFCLRFKSPAVSPHSHPHGE